MRQVHGWRKPEKHSVSPRGANYKAYAATSGECTCTPPVTRIDYRPSSAARSRMHAGPFTVFGAQAASATLGGPQRLIGEPILGVPFPPTPPSVHGVASRPASSMHGVLTVSSTRPCCPHTWTPGLIPRKYGGARQFVKKKKENK